ncbi:uncharacterized protein [Trachinotus anak]|uniref:uncharacterized protein isoform X2 n=1 Tax=Trachinotus anak TaxID=443729 RepID=UPI0039F16D30
MILLWVTLFALHHVYSLVPVITVHLGEPVTFTCTLPDVGISHRTLFWYKQSAGDTLKLIVTQRKFGEPEYAPQFSESRWEVNNGKNFINLTIVRTTQEDEGLYHCAITEWISIPVWSGTYLILKGNSQRTSKYAIVQEPKISDPVRPGDSVTLQCSVLSDSDNKTCPGDHSVYWFRAGADKSHPDIIYTDGSECEKRPDSLRSCVYRFTKNITSSDSGTYYCAVATCGEILFGDGTKLHNEGTSVWSQMATAVIFPLLAILVTSLIVIAFLICVIKKTNCDRGNAVALQKNGGGQKRQQRDEDMWVHSTVIFTMVKADSCVIQDAKAAERERIYAAVKALGFD